MVARVFFYTLWLLSATATATEFTVKIDRTEIFKDEHVVLTLLLINSDTRLRAEGLSPSIDLSTLTKDFDIGQPQTTNQFSLNQRRSTSSLSVELFPKRIGILRIPSIALDGAKTAPISLKVKTPLDNNAPEVFARASAAKTSVWQREQLVVHLDLYHRVALQSAKLGAELDTEPTPIELLDYTQLKPEERIETVTGFRYNITRRSWALFPKESGELRLRFPDIWVITQNNRKIRLPAQTQTIQVRALPATVPDTTSVGKITLTQTPLNSNQADNQFITWAVTVSGPVPLHEFPDELPLGISATKAKFYIDRAAKIADISASGIINSAVYAITVIPNSAGEFFSPPLAWTYFNPESGITTTTQLPAQKIIIAKQPPEKPSETIKQLIPVSTEKVQRSTQGYFWQATIAVFGLALALTIALRRKKTPPKSVDDDHKQEIPRNLRHILKTQLLTALQARSLDEGLVAWESQYGISPQLRITLQAVQRLCYGKGEKTADSALREQVAQAISIINSAHKKDVEKDPWSPNYLP